MNGRTSSRLAASRRNANMVPSRRGGSDAGDVQEGQAGGGDGLEAGQLLVVPGGGKLAVQDRVERHLFGDEVDRLAPQLLLLGGVVGLHRRVEQVQEFLGLGGPAPAVPLLGPGAV